MRGVEERTTGDRTRPAGRGSWLRGIPPAERSSRSPWLRAGVVAALLVPAALAGRSGGGVHVSLHEDTTRVLVAVLEVPLLLALGAAAVLMFPALVPPFLRGRRHAVLNRRALNVLIPGGLAIIAVLVGILALSGPRREQEPIQRPPPHNPLAGRPQRGPDEFP